MNVVTDNSLAQVQFGDDIEGTKDSSAEDCHVVRIEMEVAQVAGRPAHNHNKVGQK